METRTGPDLNVELPGLNPAAGGPGPQRPSPPGPAPKLSGFEPFLWDFLKSFFHPEVILFQFVI